MQRKKIVSFPNVIYPEKKRVVGSDFSCNYSPGPVSAESILLALFSVYQLGK